jgi:peptidase E
MASLRRRIAAVGGGGFLLDDASLAQERWLVSLCRTQVRPKVLFLGTASGDAERAQLKFMKAFGALGCDADTLAFFPFDMRRDYGRAVRDADLVYVGGGNTPAMLAVWRDAGIVGALREAYDAGTVLAGISAGANCWFEHYVTDSVPGGGVRDGLGWLPGTFCPHLDSEAWRHPVLQACSGPAAGAGEGVVVLYEDEAWSDAVSSAAPAAPALCLRRRAGVETLEAVEPRRLRAMPAP